MESLRVPSYYVLRRLCSDEDIQHVLHALRITPIQAVIVSDILDADFAMKLSTAVLRVSSDPAAHEVAMKVSKDTGRPVLVIGDAKFLDAVYPDGTRGPIAASA